MARLRFNDAVEKDDVKEAIRLTEIFRNSVNEDEAAEKNVFTAKTDIATMIMGAIREECMRSRERTATINDIEKKLLVKGLNNEKLNEVLQQYENLNVLYLNNKRTEVSLI